MTEHLHKSAQLCLEYYEKLMLVELPTVERHQLEVGKIRPPRYSTILTLILLFSLTWLFCNAAGHTAAVSH